MEIQGRICVASKLLKSCSLYSSSPSLLFLQTFQQRMKQDWHHRQHLWPAASWIFKWTAANVAPSWKSHMLLGRFFLYFTEPNTRQVLNIVFPMMDSCPGWVSEVFKNQVQKGLNLPPRQDQKDLFLCPSSSLALEDSALAQKVWN